MVTEKYTLNRIPFQSDLPIQPQVLRRLTEACEKYNGDSADLVALVKMDPILCLRVLRLAGFSDSSAFRKSLDPGEAVSVLGVGALKNIAICSSLQSSFEKSEEKPFFSLTRFWLHSLHCAILARSLASQSGYPRPVDAYTAGLFHDLGKLVLWIQFRESMRDLGEVCWNTEEPLSAMEERLGVFHAEAGAYFLRLWGFPSLLVDAALYHHETYSRIAQALPLVKIVHIANELCRRAPWENEGFWSGLESIFPLGKDSLIISADLALRETAERAKDLNLMVDEASDGRLFIRKSRATAGHGSMPMFHDGLSLLPESFLALVRCENICDLISVLRQELQIFMDADRVLFFLPGRERLCLQAENPAPGDKPFHPGVIEIPLEVKKSLIVSAHNQLLPLDSFSISFQREPVILDQQIISFLGKEGILCVPMVSLGASEGVIVMPVHHSERSGIYSRMRLLQLISAQAGTALRTIRLRREKELEAEQDEGEAMPLAVQKMLHEVNSPLTIVKNYLKVIGDKLSNEKPVFDELKIVAEEADRLGSILGRMPYRREIPSYELEVIDINSFLRDMVRVVKETFQREPEILFRLDLEEDLPSVEADGNTLKQIFTNLFNNSAEAMPAGGSITVRTSYGSDDSFAPSGSVCSGEGIGMVKVVVQDDGIGVPKEIRGRMFEPFISSKPKPHSGLGLSIVHGMVTALGGTISCNCTDRQGTSLIIKLPARRI